MPRKAMESKGGRVMRLVVYLPEELHKAVMHRCIDEDTSATKLAERLLREYLEGAQRKGGK